MNKTFINNYLCLYLANVLILDTFNYLLITKLSSATILLYDRGSPKLIFHGN